VKKIGITSVNIMPVKMNNINRMNTDRMNFVVVTLKGEIDAVLLLY